MIRGCRIFTPGLAAGVFPLAKAAIAQVVCPVPASPHDDDRCDGLSGNGSQ